MDDTYHGLMPHREHRHPVSRDWQDLDCKAQCEWQRGGKCIVPSIARINEEGRCIGFKRKSDIERKDVRKDEHNR